MLMRLAVICDSIDMLGGSSISAKRFMQGLRKKGHSILLVTNTVSDKNIDDPLLEGINIEFSNNIPLFRNDKFAFSNIDFNRLDKLFMDFKPDAVYSIYPTSFSGYRGIKAARRLKIPVIGHFHVQIENLSPLFEKLRIINLTYKLFIPLYNMYDKILCPSVFAEDLLKRYEIKSKTVVISNGVDTSRFKKLSKEKYEYIYDKYKIQKDIFTVLYVGRLDKEKDMMTLIKGFEVFVKDFPQAQLSVAGIGSDMAIIKEYITQKNLNSCIKVLGRVPDEDLVPLYNTANLFASASLCELEGMTLLEASACGLPLLVSDFQNSAGKFLVNQNGLTFSAKNYFDLASKFKQLYEDKSLRLRFETQSLKNANEYDFEKSLLKLENALSC